ncbi:MAG: UvrD-helicase domain-containing protein [Tissierellales bacterium]|nr:UvrD-helicase domain-containing protein [Tissierellales bacterium]
MIDLEQIMQRYNVNEEQAKALDINKNIALHAGAGSGKTRVLTRRFLKILLDTDAKIDEIVAITFTKKAALEMKERILGLINEFLKDEKDNEMVSKLNEIKENMVLSNISTFHSFCDDIIKENYYLIGIDPMYKIIENIDRQAILKKCAEEILNLFIEDDRYHNCFDMYFSSVKVKYDLKTQILNEILSIYKEITTRGDSIKEAIEYSTNNIVNYYENDENYRDCQLVIDFILEMVNAVDEKYQEEKRALNLMDFNDLERYTLEILEKSEETREKLKNRFRYFLVDEFQDTNEIQLKILLYLAEDNGKIEDGKLFVVGDIKQSIYQFRGANYKVFDQITSIIQQNGERMNLLKNYRSHDKIVKITNDIFNRIMEIYEPSETTNSLEGESGFIFTFIDNSKEETNNKLNIKKLRESKVSSEELMTLLEENESDSRIKEANFIANKVAELNNKGIQYKDVAILLRNRNSLKEFENALKEKNIPYTVLGGIGYYDSQEVKDLINLIKFMYNQDEKRSFLALMRCPFVGLSDNDVIEIFSHIKSTDDLELAKGLNPKTDLLFDLKQKASFLKIHDLIKLVDHELDIQKILLIQDDGLQKYRNYEKFLEIAIEFDNKGIYSPLEFIEYIDNLSSESDQEPVAFLDTENSDAVKIMTIHAAKGLEFEAVFIPALDYQLTKDNNENFIYDTSTVDSARLGLCFKNSKTDAMFNDIVNKKAIENRYEELRILYVGITRAIRFLSLSGIEKRNNAKTIFGELRNLPFNKYEELTKSFDNYVYISEESSLNRQFNSLNTTKVLDNINFKIDYYSKSVVSISKYMMFKDCPRKYFYRYVLYLDDNKLNKDIFLEKYEDDLENNLNAKDQMDALKLGSFIHGVLEDLILDREIDIEKEIKKCLGQIKEHQKTRIYKLIDNFLKIENNQKITKSVKTEFEFRVRLLESFLILYGIIDRLDIYEENGEEKIDIIDYKTSRVNSIDEEEKIIKDYMPQFVAYKYAIKKIYPNIEINHMYIYLLDNGKKLEVKFDHIQESYILNDIVNIFSKLETEKEYKFITEENCVGKCEYGFLCGM